MPPLPSIEMIRYRPAINVPGRNLPAFHEEECDELRLERGRDPELDGRGVGTGESIVAWISAVILAATAVSGCPQCAQNGVDCDDSLPQPRHTGMNQPRSKSSRHLTATNSAPESVHTKELLSP